MQLDYQTLMIPVTKQDIVNYRKKYYVKKSTINIFGLEINPLILFGFFIAFSSLLTAFIVSKLSPDFEGLNAPIIIQAAIVIIVFMIQSLIVDKKKRAALHKDVQVCRFAEANNLIFIPSTSKPGYSGMIFNVGEYRRAYSQIRDKSGKLFEIGNYNYTVRSGKSSTTIDNGYIMIELGRKLPNMILDSHGNNNIFSTALGYLPLLFQEGQKLSLEGDFDKYFTLYAPKEYERDALYVFTPDVMALFIDQAGSFDAEIVDDKLFIYSKGKFDLSDKTVLQRIFNIIDTVGKKTLSQTEHYSDERIGDESINSIAESGRRLKSLRSIPMIFILMLIIILIVNMSINFMNFLEPINKDNRLFDQSIQ